MRGVRAGFLSCRHGVANPKISQGEDETPLQTTELIVLVLFCS